MVIYYDLLLKKEHLSVANLKDLDIFKLKKNANNMMTQKHG